MLNFGSTSWSEPGNLPVNGEEVENAPLVNITLDESAFVSKPNFDDAMQNIRFDMEDQLKRLREKFDFVQQNLESRIRFGGSGDGQASGSDEIAAFITKGYHCASCGSVVNAAQMRWRSAAPRSSHRTFPARCTSRGAPKTPDSRMLEKKRYQMALNEARSPVYVPGLGDLNKNAKPKDPVEMKRENLNKQLSLPDLSQKEVGIVNIGLDLPKDKLNLFKHHTRVWSPRFQARRKMEAINNAPSGAPSPKTAGSNQQRLGTSSIGEFLSSANS